MDVCVSSQPTAGCFAAARERAEGLHVSQAGLMDILLARDFAQSHTIFVCYARSRRGRRPHRRSTRASDRR